MTSKILNNIFSELIGTWELVHHVSHPLHNQNDERYPMGHDAKAIITYCSDGYMSAQFLLHGQQILPEENRNGQQPVGSESFMAYAGEFYLEDDDDEGPVVMHKPRITNLPHMLNQIQKRAIDIVDNGAAKYLYLRTVEPVKVSGDDSILRVKWRKFPENKPYAS